METYNAAATFVDEPLARGWGPRVAFRDDHRAVSYQAFADLTNRTGNALRELGVEMEQRVMLLLYDSPEFAAGFFGTIKVGAVAVPICTVARPDDLLYYLTDSRARVLIVHEPLLEAVEPIADRLRYLRHVVVVATPASTEMPRSVSTPPSTTTPASLGKGLSAAPPGLRLWRFEEIVSRAGSALEAADTAPDDAAFWLYTSGSTGPPKGAVHLQRNMLYCADTVARHVFAYASEDIAYSVSKLYFAYGLGNGLYFPLRFGAGAVHDPGRPTPEGVFDIIHRHRPTLVFTVPTMYARLLQIADTRERYDLTSVRLYVSSGEPLPAALFHRWQEHFGLPILDVVGSTENLHDFLANRPEVLRPGSSGVPVPGYECRIVDDHGRDVETGQAGHLLVRGGSAASGYWNRGDATRRTMLGEWLRTGDEFSRDDEGFYWYCGRSDDLLKVAGLWVSPHEVEHALLAHQAVLEAAVVGAPDGEGLLHASAYVVLNEGHVPSPALTAELLAFARERLAAYKVPRWIEYVGELPRTATGKIQRFRLRTGGRRGPGDREPASAHR